MKTTVQYESCDATERRAPVEFTAPEINIYETKDGYVIEAEMPGVNKEGLGITLEGTEITMTGHPNNAVPAGEVLFRERRALDFRRVFELDSAIDTAKISAEMHQGMLTLTLPKSERVKPRRIAVNG